MKRYLYVGLGIVVLSCMVLTGCGNNDNGNNAAGGTNDKAAATTTNNAAATNNAASTTDAAATNDAAATTDAAATNNAAATNDAAAADTTAPAASSTKLNAAKFVGINETLDVKKADIKIDGSGDDWNGIDSYDITKNTDGNDLKYPAKVSLAWDGSSTLFVKGTLTAGGPFKAAHAADSSDWWDDDILELFLVPVLPPSEAENKVNATHFAANSKLLFQAPDLAHNGAAKNISLKDGEWVVEMSVTLEGDVLNAVKSGSVFAKVGIELNSAQEFSLFGRKGGFWDVDNYIQLNTKA